MARGSQLIFEKFLDHFGLWDEPAVVKKSVTKEKKKQKILKREKAKKPREDRSKERRDEILVFIKEIAQLDSEHTRSVRAANESYVKNRQEQIIYTKKFLKDEFATSRFVQAS
jgi:hypothetical protein